jgi:hypothetical protein
MATEKQIAANRQNAKHSTGPRTDNGKRRSRRNAMRHGLTAETVINVLEDPVAYKALQRAIHTDYCPRSNFELQLVGRLVSLLWRLRRATAIESGMLAQSDIPTERKNLKQFYELIPTLVPRPQFHFDLQNSGQMDRNLLPNRDDSRFSIAQSFMRISRLDGNPFERLGRYEARLWRQTLQTILLLNSLNTNSNENTDSARNFSNFSRSVERRRHIHWPPFCPHK